MASIKATYVAPGKDSKAFDVPVTSLVDSIQTMQDDINKFLTHVLEEEKKQGIKQPEIKEDEEPEEDEEMNEEEQEEEEEGKEESQALKKQKLEA